VKFRLPSNHESQVGIYECIGEDDKHDEPQREIYWHSVMIFHVHSNGYWSHVSAAHDATQPLPLPRIWRSAPSGNLSGAWNPTEQKVAAIEEGCWAKDNALATRIWHYQPWVSGQYMCSTWNVLLTVICTVRGAGLHQDSEDVDRKSREGLSDSGAVHR
jgi:hypothetical protein